MCNEVLPCGLVIDMVRGECCLTRCQDPAISREPDRKKKCLLIEACSYWPARKKQQEEIERELARISAEKLGPRRVIRRRNYVDAG